jgi:glucose-1-phosphate thymidylyltransferase
MIAFILAGGFATRLWPLTEKRPKPLLPLAGKPTLNHIIDAMPAGLPITVSTNAAFAGAFHAWKQTMRHEDLNLVIEQTATDDQKLGTLGALSQWIQTQDIQDDILFIAGDNYFGFSVESFLAQYHPGTPLLAAYDIHTLEQAKRFGTVILDADTLHIAAFEEKPAEPKTTLVSTGASIIPASTFPQLIAYARHKPDNIGGIFEEFIRLAVPVECFTFREPWFDIGSFESYLEATRALVGDALLLQDATFKDSEREGSVVLGKGTKVMKSTLRNTVIFEDCVIEDCVLEDCVIDSGCVLKGADLTGKMIREGTTLTRS